jgi:hypothetical protein
MWGEHLENCENNTARTNGSKILSNSMKVFGLMLINNYFKKWQILVEGGIEDTESVQEAVAAKNSAGEKESKHQKTRKVHKKVLGHCKYGRWSSAGIQQVNALCKLVEQD